MRGIVKAILFITIVVSCTNDELCVGKGTNKLKIRLLESGIAPESPISITFNSISVSGDPANYTVFADTTLSLIGLSVDPDTTWTRFVLIAADRTDTLEVSYKITPSFISVDCGPEILFSKLDTVYHTFDSLIINQDLFDREIDTNISIYY